MIKLSFIIPCYNAEKYIGRCLDSIYNQDIPESEFEVICVNDCSPDNMRDVILEYQKRYSNLILIEHAENKRQGGARNTGLKNAKGKYVWFIDNDDDIRENCVGKMLSVCFENDLDLLLFNLDSQKVNLTFIEQHETITGSSYLKKWLDTNENERNRQLAMYSIWARLLKLDFLKNNNIYFRENMPILEDVPVAFRTFCFAQRVQALNQVNYFFRENPSSSSRTRHNADKLFNGRFGIIDEQIKLSEEIQNTSILIADWLKGSACYELSRIKMEFTRQTIGEQWKFVKLMRQHRTLAKSFIKRIGSIMSFNDKLILRYPLLLFIIGYSYRGMGFLKKKLKK